MDLHSKIPFVLKGQEPAPSDTDPVLGAEAGPVPPWHSCQGILHHHAGEDPQTHSHVHPQPAERTGTEAFSVTESLWFCAIM